jgi:hypothetical protein
MRSDHTKRAGGENAYFQDVKDGDAVPYGTTMAHDFLLEHNLHQVRDDLKKVFESMDDPKLGLNFEEMYGELENLHSSVIKLQRVERVVMYSTMRYIIRDQCEIRQRTLRKRLNTTCSLK